MTTISSNRVPSPLRRSLQKLSGGESSSGSIAVPQSPGSFATEATARSSLSGNNEDLFFRIVDSSTQGHPQMESSKSDLSSFRSKKNMWNSSPNLKVDPADLGDKWEFDTMDFNSSFNADMKPRRGSTLPHDDRNTGEKARGVASTRAVPGRMSSFSMKPVVAGDGRVTSAIAKASSIADDLSAEMSMEDQKSEVVAAGQHTSGTKVKKRIKVRAGELNMDSSTGSKSIDRQHVEEAVRRWQSEHGMGSSTDGDLSSMQRVISRRRVSAASDGKDGESSGMNTSDGGGERIRVIVRRSKSLDESCSSFMASVAAGSEGAPRRATRRSVTSAATPSRARSKSRSRRCSTASTEQLDDETTSQNVGSERALTKPRQRSVSRGRRMSVSQPVPARKEDDDEQVPRDAPTRSRQRSVSRGRRASLAASAAEDAQVLPSRSRSRVGERRASCAADGERATAQRSHSLGRHLQRSNHEAQAKEKKSIVSSSRSVGLKSAGGESRETIMSAPGRLSTAGSGSILQRRRSRSIARADARSSESVASCTPTMRKPLGQQHPMNDLTRNHRSAAEGGGSSVFTSRIAPPIEEPSSQDAESELSRLMKETGITTEQFLKLQEAGYLLKPSG